MQSEVVSFGSLEVCNGDHIVGHIIDSRGKIASLVIFTMENKSLRQYELAIALEKEIHWCGNDISLFPSKGVIAVGSREKLYLYDYKNNNFLGEIKGNYDYINKVSFNHDCTKLATASDDWCVHLYNIDTLEEKNLFAPKPKSRHIATKVAFHPRQKNIIISSDDQIRLWDTSGKKNLLASIEGKNFSFDASGSYISDNSKGIYFFPSEESFTLYQLIWIYTVSWAPKALFGPALESYLAQRTKEIPSLFEHQPRVIQELIKNLVE